MTSITMDRGLGDRENYLVRYVPAAVGYRSGIAVKHRWDSLRMEKHSRRFRRTTIEPRMMPMKISVDQELCDAHGQCSTIDEALFPLDEEGYSAVGLGTEVPPGREGVAQEGVAACPIQALSIE
jgi:ferredoxin